MYSEIVILAMLANHPMHGYEIKKSVEQVLNHCFPVSCQFITCFYIAET